MSAHPNLNPSPKLSPNAVLSPYSRLNSGPRLSPQPWTKPDCPAPLPPGPPTTLSPCPVPIHPQGWCHLSRAALPLPGRVPTAPDSGPPGACPTTFRGSLCKHGVPPNQPPGIIRPTSPGGGWGEGGRAGDKKPCRIPTAHACGPTDLCLGGMGVPELPAGGSGNHPLFRQGN